MKIIKQQLPDFTLPYHFYENIPEDKILFIDIETTGFTARSSYLYLIGCGHMENGCWCIKQFFADNYSEEIAILEAFFSFIKPFSYLIHFNGNNFDLPFLLQKCQMLNLPYNFDSFQGIDIYKRIAPYKFFLKLSNCKQKTLEAFLQMDREDIYNGGELISVYHAYVKEKTDAAYQALLLHNAEDVKGMMELLPILSYYDLFNTPIKVKKVQANSYTDLNGIIQKELLMKLSLTSPLPVPVSFMANNCYFTGKDKEAALRIPIFEGELKYFYSGYQDYYYLPEEDMAIHKKVASFVDKEHRQKATAATCYTRKISSYLPEWDILFEPFFKRDYKSKELFFELTDEIKQDRTFFGNYASHILDMLASAY